MNRDKTFTFQATEEKVKEIIANAVNASGRNGLGIFAFRVSDKVYTPEDFHPHETDTEYKYSVDYHDGRMVKIEIKKMYGIDNCWGFSPTTPDPRYQGWANTYPTPREMILSAYEGSE